MISCFENGIFLNPKDTCATADPRGRGQVGHALLPSYKKGYKTRIHSSMMRTSHLLTNGGGGGSFVVHSTPFKEPPVKDAPPIMTEHPLPPL